MLKYFIRRFIAMFPRLIVISILIFLGLQLLPGDAVTAAIGPMDQMPQATIDALREAKGLNDPLYIRYFIWLKDILGGDFGYSLTSGSPILSMLAVRLPATLELFIISNVVATIAGILMGFISAVRQNTLIDYLNEFVSMIGISIPTFFFGMITIAVFAVQLRWFPAGGRMGVGQEAFFSRIQYLVLPSLCFIFSMIGGLARSTRVSMLDVMNKDYIKTARAKGLSEWVVNTRHCFRNGCSPVILTLVFRITMIFTGSVIIESLFSFPGMGNLMLSAIATRDTPVIMAFLMLISVSIVFCSFLADVLLAAMDPRIRFEKREAK